MNIATPKDFLTELFLGMTWDGPSEDIPPTFPAASPLEKPVATWLPTGGHA